MDRASERSELITIIHPGGFEVDWRETEGTPAAAQQKIENEFYDRSSRSPSDALFYLGFTDRRVSLSFSFSFLRDISGAFIKSLSEKPEIEFLRDKLIIEPGEQILEKLLDGAPFMTGSEFLSVDWLRDIWTDLNKSFASAIKEYDGSAAEFLSSLNPSVHLVGRVYFHLVENRKGDLPFAFLATYSSEADMSGKTRHLPLKNALTEYKGNNKKLLELLSTVNKAAKKSRFAAQLLESGEIFHPIGLDAKEAYTFLKEVPVYEEAGILCRIPAWWKKKTGSFGITIKIGSKEPSRVGFDAIMDFDIRLSMGDEELSYEEMLQILNETEGLCLIKGKWVEVDKKKLKETLDAYQKALKLAEGGRMSLSEAMKFQMDTSLQENIFDEDIDIEVTNGEWLSSLFGRLRDPEIAGDISCGEDFHAELRAYQQKGLYWLEQMKMLGFGACLADDMGLGKTLQVIALLNSIRGRRNEKTLLVIPASLIGNWVNEIDRFAPSLRYMVLHPTQGKTQSDGDEDITTCADLFITTYGMLQRLEWVREQDWDNVVLDEAQAIKNPGTKQTRNAKKLKASYRIAMTGTPIENRLSDLWSLFDFLNKGMLGSSKEFSEFVNRIKDSREGYSRLKNAISPFVLRRLKTDKSVIADLPEKIEMKTYASLTRKQAALYNGLVNDIMEKIESADEGIERKGLVLSSLMKFKQICNHPDQYLGQGFYDEKESGKYSRLREICETIYEKRERVLVFTQFKEITEHLAGFLEKVFEHRGLVLHGGTPVSKRKDIVNEFQGPRYVPFMVLSIKAGGVGLNLTKANHVIHFDRWWNPAVENQATDRAFRIGQHKNVIVHKFITEGTIEEKIDMMIEDKMKLSSDVISAGGEKWITEMDNKQLRELFSLAR